MKLIARGALYGAAVFGIYAAVTLASDWRVLKGFWKKHTSEYDPQDRDSWGV